VGRRRHAQRRLIIDTVGMTSAAEPLALDVWADIACPWCFIGLRHLDQVLADREDVEVRYRAYELQPTIPPEGIDRAGYFERLFGSAEASASASAAVVAAGQGPQGPPRRQGRQPRRDDQPRACRCRPASPSPPRPAATYLEHGATVPPGCRRDRRAPRAPRGRPWAQARRPRRPAAGLGPLRREVLDARDDGDRPQHRPQRRQRRGPGPSSPATSGSPGTPTAGWCRCSARPCSASTARRSSTRWTRQGRAKGVDDDLDLTPTTCGARRRYKAIVREHTGSEFPQDPRAARPGRSARSSTPGTPSAPCSTAARSASRRPRHRGQRAGDGLRQPRPRLGHRRGLHPRPRRPAHQGVYGDYLQNAQGEDVVAGIRNTLPLAELEKARQGLVRRAAGHHGTLERTTATCATSSSPSSAASCGCCRPAWASAPPAPRSGSPSSWSTRASSTMDEALHAGSPAPSSPS
jgi:hypothetical protein